MKIALLTPGAGDNFYCENCMRDAAILRQLIASGHQVTSVPLYLPPLDPDTGRSSSPKKIFFGGVNVFLQQKMSFFRRSPRWLDGIFDSRWLLKLAGRATGMTNAKLLGEMTVSMLAGEDGLQAKELQRLCKYLVAENPDVIVLSNALLLGAARQLAEKCGCIIACWLQDEDHFLDSLGQPFAQQAWKLLARRCEDADLLLSPSEYYKEQMSARLNLPSERITVLPQGVAEENFAELSEPEIPTIGFLSQFSEDKGLEVLLEATAKLHNQYISRNFRVIAGGGQTMADRDYVDRINRIIGVGGLRNRVELRREFDIASKQKFFSDISVLAVPTQRPESYGLYILEAIAAGVPVVIPDHGGQAELVHKTGGGLLYTPRRPDSLAGKMFLLLNDLQLREKLTLTGQQNVRQHYMVSDTAAKLTELCQQAIDAK